MNEVIMMNVQLLMDSRPRRDDDIHLDFVIPAKAGIHASNKKGTLLLC